MRGVVQRKDKEIQEMHQELWDRVWWVRHKCLLQKIKRGEAQETPEGMRAVNQGKKAAQKIEKKYGRKTLVLDTFEWGLLSGRMSALSWIMGCDWDGSLDT